MMNDFVFGVDYGLGMMVCKYVNIKVIVVKFFV